MIDQCISAEFPDPEEDLELYNIIRRQMFHGPCGTLNKNSPCIKDGRCTKKFPKRLVEETQCGEDGYPKYRRKHMVKVVSQQLFDKDNWER